MNIELDEIVVMDVSDDALEEAASGGHAQAVFSLGSFSTTYCCSVTC
jgi:hypothetical protein